MAAPYEDELYLTNTYKKPSHWRLSHNASFTLPAAPNSVFSPIIRSRLCSWHGGLSWAPVTGILLYLYAVHCPVVSTRHVRCSMGHISPSGWLMGIVRGDITSVISEGPLVGASASPSGPTGCPSGVGGGKAKKAKHPKRVRFSKSEAVFPPCRYIQSIFLDGHIWLALIDVGYLTLFPVEFGHCKLRGNGGQ